MGRRRIIGLVAFAASLLGCASLLGDFSVGDASTTDATNDVGNDVAAETGADVVADVVKDVATEAEAGPTCGQLTQACCTTGQACSGTATCCGNICVDTASDQKNCGTCNHGCLTASCNGGQCQAAQLVKVVDTRPGRVRLGGSNAYFITVNGNNSGSLYSCSQQGCSTPTVLFGSLGYAYDLVLDDNAATAYVSDSGGQKIFYCPVGGCNQVPGIVSTAANGNMYGLAFRSNIFAIISNQPHEFKTDGSSDVALGNGNEGANYITAPPNSQYVYWQMAGNHEVRVGKDNVAQSVSAFWTSTTDNVLQVESNGSTVAWVGESSTATSIYTCAVSSSCTNNSVIASGNVGYESGALTVDASNGTVYWVGVDGTSSHVFVRSCPVNGCTSPTTVTTIATQAGGAVAGGVATDQTYVYFTFEDKGPVYLSRVAK